MSVPANRARAQLKCAAINRTVPDNTQTHRVTLTRWVGRVRSMNISLAWLPFWLLAIPSVMMAQRPVSYELNVGAALPTGTFGTDTVATGIGAEGLAEFFS